MHLQDLKDNSNLASDWHRFSILRGVTGSLQIEALVAALCAAQGANSVDAPLTRTPTEAKDLRYCSHLTESVRVPSIIGTSVHQALNTAVALGYGSEMVPSLVKAQAQINQVTISKA